MTVMTNHNKAAGCFWSVSQSWQHAMPVGHIRWQLSVAAVWAASVDPLLHMTGMAALSPSVDPLLHSVHTPLSH